MRVHVDYVYRKRCSLFVPAPNSYLPPLSLEFPRHNKTHQFAKTQMSTDGGKECKSRNTFTSVQQTTFYLRSSIMGATKALKSLSKTIYPKTSSNKNKEDYDSDGSSNVVKRSKQNSKKLKSFWQQKHQQKKRRSDHVSLKDQALSVDGNNIKLQVFLSPVTAPETEASPLQDEGIPNNQVEETNATPFNISEVLTHPGKEHSLNMSPLTTYSEQNEQTFGSSDEGLAEALQLPSFEHVPTLNGAMQERSHATAIAIPNTKRRIRAYGMSARRRAGDIVEEPPRQKLDAPAATDGPNPFDDIPDVFDNLQSLLDDIPESKAHDGPQETSEAVLQRETAKGLVGDPIDLTDCDYRLFLRKPADAVAVGLGMLRCFILLLLVCSSTNTSNVSFLLF